MNIKWKEIVYNFIESLHKNLVGEDYHVMMTNRRKGVQIEWTGH